MKQTMKQHSFTSQLKSLALVFGIALAFASCANEDVAQNPTSPNEDNDKNLTTFVAGDEAKTRTSLNYNSSDFYWEAGDYIYVKDDNNVLQKSSNAPTSKVASFKYKVPGKFTDHSSYEVYYLGKNSNATDKKVTISTAQTQTKPDNTEHFGTAGDYGTATATKVPNKQQFAFELEHQAAYLVFHPYVSNTLLQSCYLTKIEVSSDNDIASTYTLNASTGTLQSGSTGATTDKEIILSTQGSGAYTNGFPLSTASDNVAVNGAYMVIKPGTHNLKVRYWLKDVSTGIEGTVTKAFKAFNYDVNNYYDIDGNLNIRDYDGDYYYMWDAQEQYWKGYEWTKNLGAGVGQPTIGYGLPGATTSSNYAQNNSDPNNRWYHEGSGASFNATRSCSGIPNVNEMTWYADKGDPRWDEDEIWTTMGHLHKGGMWFKKKSQISGYNPNTAYDGSDWRTANNEKHWTPSLALPSAAEANNYFYLPALGLYSSGQLYFFGDRGYYWSSSIHQWYTSFPALAHLLYFYSGSVCVTAYDRNNGFRVDTFK